jgi:EmrB/QacA subfamily drug resistance transporter
LNQQSTAAEDNSFWLPLMVVVLGAFAAILNNSSVNVALPKLMAIFGVASDEIQWVLTSYMLVSGVVIPVTGYLGDRFGTKKVYLVASLVFTLGSLLCSFAWNNSSMIFARIIQGLGGGMVMPISMAIVYRIVPRHKIGLALGIWGMAAVCAPAIGPTLGGYIVDHFSWRLLFTINIPVGITGILLGYLLLPESPLNKDTSFDLWGFILCTTGCFTLLLALSQGNREGWTSYYILSLLLISFFTLLLFVLVELAQEQPMLNLRLFKNHIFTISVFAGSMTGIGLFGGIFLIPLFTQNLMMLTPYQTGVLLIPSALAAAFMMPVSGFLFDRFGARALAIVGLGLTAWGTWELRKLSVEISYLSLIYLTTLRSIGMGLATMPIATAGMNTVPLNQIARASSLNNVIRQVAASFGIAILTAVMQNRQVFHYARFSELVTVNSAAVSSLSQLQIYLTTTTAGAAGAKSAASSILAGLVVRESQVLAMCDTFIVGTFFIAAAIPFAFFLGKPKKEPGPAPARSPNFPSTPPAATGKPAESPSA